MDVARRRECAAESRAAETLRIFICWSGPASYRAASLIRQWLSELGPVFQPKMSGDIDKGSRWFEQLAVELEACDAASSASARRTSRPRGSTSKPARWPRGSRGCTAESTRISSGRARPAEDEESVIKLQDKFRRQVVEAMTARRSVTLGYLLDGSTLVASAGVD